jgi:hypothetical protein
MPKPKKDRNYSYLHAALRFGERYGDVLSRENWEALAKLCIKQGTGGALAMEVNGVTYQTTHVVELNGRKIACVYENTRNCVTTVLPPAQFGI